MVAATSGLHPVRLTPAYYRQVADFAVGSPSDPAANFGKLPETSVDRRNPGSNAMRVISFELLVFCFLAHTSAEASQYVVRTYFCEMANQIPEYDPRAPRFGTKVLLYFFHHRHAQDFRGMRVKHQKIPTDEVYDRRDQ
jgi:hypothetical protein